MKNIDLRPKELLTNLTNRFLKNYVRLIIIFGSQSYKSSKIPNEASDIDFLVIYKRDANPYKFWSVIEECFKKEGVKYDYSWYEEDDFLSVIDAGIDYLFWINILENGEILHADENYVSTIKEKLAHLTPELALRSSIDSRLSEVYKSSIDIIRDLHVILIYMLWTKYWVLKGELPKYDALLSKLQEEGIIDKEAYSLLVELGEIRKALKSGDMSVQEIRKVLELANKILEKDLFRINFINTKTK